MHEHAHAHAHAICACRMRTCISTAAAARMPPALSACPLPAACGRSTHLACASFGSFGFLPSPSESSRVRLQVYCVLILLGILTLVELLSQRYLSSAIAPAVSAISGATIGWAAGDAAVKRLSDGLQSDRGGCGCTLALRSELALRPKPLPPAARLLAAASLRASLPQPRYVPPCRAASSSDCPGALRRPRDCLLMAGTSSRAARRRRAWSPSSRSITSSSRPSSSCCAAACSDAPTPPSRWPSARRPSSRPSSRRVPRSTALSATSKRFASPPRLYRRARSRCAFPRRLDG